MLHLRIPCQLCEALFVCSMQCQDTHLHSCPALANEKAEEEGEDDAENLPDDDYQPEGNGDDEDGPPPRKPGAPDGKVPRSSSSAAHYGSCKPPKEEEMKLSTPPDKAIQAKAWQRETKAEIAKSTGRGKAGWCWAREVEHKTFEELGYCDPEFLSSDVRLLAACDKIAKHNNAAARIALETDKLDLNGDMLSGRQALWIIYDEFRTDSSKDLLFGITHMTAVKCTDADCPKALRVYFNRWNHLLTGLKEPWNTDSRENLMTRESLPHEQIQNSKHPLLSGPLNAHRMAERTDTKTKCYDYSLKN